MLALMVDDCSAGMLVSWVTIAQQPCMLVSMVDDCSAATHACFDG